MGLPITRWMAASSLVVQVTNRAGDIVGRVPVMVAVFDISHLL
jgi:hypothetical protein